MNSSNEYLHDSLPMTASSRFLISTDSKQHNSLVPDNRKYFKVNDNVLSTFQQNSSNGSSPRIISNPISKYDTNSDTSSLSRNDDLSNPYFVSEDLSHKLFSNYPTSNKSLSTHPSPPIRYNMNSDIDNSFVFFNNSTRRSGSNIHDQIAKDRINHKKRNKCNDNTS